MPLRPILSAALLALPIAAAAQQQPLPAHPYRAPELLVQGLFVTPIPGAPFTADVDISSTQKLDDGTTSTRVTVAHIARDNSGRIYNERRALVPATFPGEPPLISGHIYDPATRTSIFTTTFNHLARLQVLPYLPANAETAHNLGPLMPGMQDKDLGTQVLAGIPVQGTLRTQVISAQRSGTGSPVTVTDEYWFSPDLAMFALIHHTDPRTGEQTVALSHIQRAEPNPSTFAVPAGYKLVDETPPDEAPSPAARH